MKILIDGFSSVEYQAHICSDCSASSQLMEVLQDIGVANTISIKLPLLFLLIASN